MIYMYHATPLSNLCSILDQGISPGPDSVVYLCERAEDVVKFLLVRGYKNILVCKVKLLKADECKISETFDHSERFFKCRAFGYAGHIESNKIAAYIKYCFGDE